MLNLKCLFCLQEKCELEGGMILDKKELEQDFTNRWGNAQKCNSCGYVLPYGPYDKLKKCCGKIMKPVK